MQTHMTYASIYKPVQTHIKYEPVHTNINIYGNKTCAKLVINYSNNNKKYSFQTHKHYCLMVAKLYHQLDIIN